MVRRKRLSRASDGILHLSGTLIPPAQDHRTCPARFPKTANQPFMDSRASTATGLWTEYNKRYGVLHHVAWYILHTLVKAKLSDPTIKLRVTKHDDETETLNVYRGVFDKSSDFFQRAMEPEWTKLREEADIIDLVNDSVLPVSN